MTGKPEVNFRVAEQPDTTDDLRGFRLWGNYL
jgi:hypothetical protein